MQNVGAIRDITFNNVTHVTLAGRYNRTSLQNRDRSEPGGGAWIARRRSRV